jgi:hypothetical protein
MECPKSTGKTSAFGKSAVLFPFAKTAFASALLVLAMAASQPGPVAQPPRENVLDHREAFDDIELLEHHANLPAQQTEVSGTEAQNVGLCAVGAQSHQGAGNHNGTRTRIDEPIDAAEQG